MTTNKKNQDVSAKLPTDVSVSVVFDPLTSESRTPVLFKSLVAQRKFLASLSLHEVHATSTIRDVNGQKVTHEWLTVEPIPRKVENGPMLCKHDVDFQTAYCKDCDPEPQLIGLNNSVTQREINSRVSFYNMVRKNNGLKVTYDDVRVELMRGYKK